MLNVENCFDEMIDEANGVTGLMVRDLMDECTLSDEEVCEMIRIWRDAGGQGNSYYLVRNWVDDLELDELEQEDLYYKREAAYMIGDFI